MCGACGSGASAARTGNVEVIRRGAGTQLGAVSASAAVTENRDTKEIKGDTGKYGYIENIPASRVTTGKKPDPREKQKYTVPQNAAEIAYTNAVYEIIQKAKKLGATGVTNVISNVERNYDPDSRIEEIKVSVSADAVKLLK